MHLQNVKYFLCFIRVIVDNRNNGLSQSTDVDVEEQLSAP